MNLSDTTTATGYQVVSKEDLSSKIEKRYRTPSWEEVSANAEKLRVYRQTEGSEEVTGKPPVKDIETLITREAGLPVLHFIQSHLDLCRINHVLFTASLYLDTSPLTLSNVRAAVLNKDVRAIIDFKLTNHTRFINKYFKAINSLLPDAGIYIGAFEANHQRTDRVYGRTLNSYKKVRVFLDFILHRVCPRMGLTKKIYFHITKGNYRFLSKAEVLGRLVSCGFDIIDFKVIQNLTYFVVMKTGEPQVPTNPTYGPLVRLNRVGKNGKIIKVYKFRTMYPYSEFIQDFVVKMNGYTEKGKPARDFRVTGWGKLFRKFWLDETPQLLNVLKGELKLVGVRPLSFSRFRQLPEDLQVARLKEKPGCIPPYVSLNMPSDEGNIEAERIYLKDREKSRFTDIRYFFKALKNILTRKIVSE